MNAAEPEIPPRAVATIREHWLYIKPTGGGMVLKLLCTLSHPKAPGGRAELECPMTDAGDRWRRYSKGTRPLLEALGHGPDLQEADTYAELIRGLAYGGVLRGRLIAAVWRDGTTRTFWSAYPLGPRAKSDALEAWIDWALNNREEIQAHAADADMARELDGIEQELERGLGV